MKHPVARILKKIIKTKLIYLTTIFFADFLSIKFFVRIFFLHSFLIKKELFHTVELFMLLTFLLQLKKIKNEVNLAIGGDALDYFIVVPSINENSNLIPYTLDV